MFVNVIVPSYNRLEILKKSIAALTTQSLTKDKYQIILVDDASTDGTDIYINSIKDDYDNLIYLRHDQNMGLASSRNTGISYAKRGILLFLDSDIVVEYNFVEMHLTTHIKYGNANIAVVSNVRYPDHLIEHSNFSKFIQSRYLGCRSAKELLRIDFTDLPSRCFAGGVSSVRHSDIVDVGMCDGSFRTYGGEDEELGWRLKNNGVRIVFCEKAIAWHYDEVSIDRYKAKLIETSSGSYRVIMNKNIAQFKDSKISYLLPINIKDDDTMKILTKLIIRFFLNPFFTTIVEAFIRKTDHIPVCYCHPLYRMISARWALYGLTSQPQNKSVVW